MSTLIWAVCTVAAIWALAYFRVNRYVWIAGTGLILLVLDWWSGIGSIVSSVLWIVFLAIAVVMAMPGLRRSLVSDRLLGWFRTALPQVSRTEQEALDAGTVWWDGELFSGKPSWAKLLATPQPQLTPEEQAFVDGPVEELCRLCDDWEITHELNNLPEDVAQNGLVKYFINRMNKKWETQRVYFDQEDYKAITDAYWKNYPHRMLSVELSEIQTSEIVERARKEEVTVNSALSVAFAGAQSFVQGEHTYNDSIVMAASLRDRIPKSCGEGMGFYAGGVQLKFRYNHKQNFWDNVRNFHQKASPQFSNKILFKEALTWSYLDPAICEALNFKKIGRLVPEQDPRYEKLFTFSNRDDVVLSILKREKMETFDNIILGTAITNLTRMDFPRKYGKLELDRLFFKPGGAFPLSNINLLLGAVTCSGKLSLILEYSDKNIETGTMEMIKNQAISFLLSA